MDRAPSAGFYQGSYQGRWFTSSWPSQLSDTPQSSALFKLYPLVVATFLWGKKWMANSILAHCDNEAAVQCSNKGRSHSALKPFLRRLIWIPACVQFILTVIRIPFHEDSSILPVLNDIMFILAFLAFSDAQNSALLPTSTQKSTLPSQIYQCLTANLFPILSNKVRQTKLKKATSTNVHLQPPVTYSAVPFHSILPSIQKLSG